MNGMLKKEVNYALNNRINMILGYKYVPLKIDGYKIVLGNTKKKRSLAGSEYNERRQ
jgi:galactokinase